MTETTRADAPSGRTLLDRIDSPRDLQRLAPEELPRLCEEIRAFLLSSVQQTGGHLGSNLGTVELTVALHRVFDFRRDRLVFDVSHQAYAHKILTGRRTGFPLLRQTGGMCGFTNPIESEYDLFHTGHAGTAISLGLGLALAGAHEAEPPHVVSLVGDAALGAGVAFEALNHAAASGARLVVVLNDNEWSISKSVGGLARYLSRIRSSRLVQRAHQEMQGLIQAIPVIGPRVDRTLEQIGEVMRHAVVPGHIFEELGVTYVGPIDGHDVGLLVDHFTRAKGLEGVVLIHALTEKGRGHPKAPTHPERVHGVKAPEKPSESPRDKARDSGSESAKLPPRAVAAEAQPAVGPAYTKAFADALIRLAERDMRVQAITAAMPSGTGLDAFGARFPARFHDTGITEQHAVALAAGMAKGGLRPVAAIYSTFLQRGYDQVFQEVALQDLPVVLVLDRAGLVGADGPTHNGVFDLAFLRTLPNIVLAAPRDASDMERMLELGLRHDGPFALRFPRDNCPGQERIHRSERREMAPGRAEVLVEGDGVVVWAYGALVNQALEASDRLARRGVKLGVVDARFAKPLDVELLSRHAQTARWIVTLEEHQRAGGFGSAVLEALNALPPTSARVKVLALPDRFVDHRTTREEQLSEAGLDADGIERCVRALLQPSLA
ncbi:MAG: 1-deoxy-D-xylulose-5-phosphate synthase [Planctomycetota bacterium]|nr:1-deoxy-D-xylulose-5-phosphate synthase [Planctomycetota bacterium]